MEPNKNRLLSRGILAVLIPCVVLALGVLAWLLIRPGAAPAEAAAAPKPTISPSPIFVTATPAPTATPEPTPSPTPEPTATPVPTPVPVELGETEDAGQEYIDKIVFLGDSTTYWAYGYGVLPHTQVWTGYQCTLSLFNLPVEPIEYYDPATPDVAESLLIPQCAAKRQPEILVTTQGLNGISGLTEEQFKGYYIDMIHAIQEASPDTKIICQSAFPVNDRESRNVSNEDINTANQWIYEIAEETGVRYLNSHDLLMDENGQLRDEYNNHDGLGFHINGDGWRAVLMNVRTHAWL